LHSAVSFVEAETESLTNLGLVAEATVLGHLSGDEMIVANRDYPCKIIGEKLMRGRTWYLIKWKPTLEPQENVGRAAIRAWQRKKKHKKKSRARQANVGRQEKLL